MKSFSSCGQSVLGHYWFFLTLTNLSDNPFGGRQSIVNAMETDLKGHFNLKLSSHAFDLTHS